MPHNSCVRQNQPRSGMCAIFARDVRHLRQRWRTSRPVTEPIPTGKTFAAY